MFPLAESPKLVQHNATFFASVFTERAFAQCRRYLSGLIVSENKTVAGINRLFVLDSRNQSTLSRLLTESPFAVEALTQTRLALLASLPGTQMKSKGVHSVDDPHFSPIRTICTGRRPASCASVATNVSVRFWSFRFYESQAMSLQKSCHNSATLFSPFPKEHRVLEQVPAEDTCTTHPYETETQQPPVSD